MRIKCTLFIAVLYLFSAGASLAELNMDNDMSMGALAFGGGSEKADIDKCPQGAKVIDMFLYAWQQEDFEIMYELIDDDSKKDYPFSQARLDFQFMEFKPYKISSVRPNGDNFAFILTYGDYKDGDKDLKKMIISGTTYKILLSEGPSVFKRSVESYM